MCSWYGINTIVNVLQELQSPYTHPKSALNPTTSLLSLILCPLSLREPLISKPYTFFTFLAFSGVPLPPCHHPAGAKATWGQHKARPFPDSVTLRSTPGTRQLDPLEGTESVVEEL